MSNSGIKLRMKWKAEVAKLHTQLTILQTLISMKRPLRWTELVERSDLPPSALKLRLNELTKNKTILRNVVRSREYPPPVLYSINTKAPLTPILRMAFFLVVSGLPQYWEILIPEVKFPIGDKEVSLKSGDLAYWWKICMAIHSFLLEKAIGWGERITEEEKQLFRLVVNELASGSPLIRTGLLVHKMGYGWDVDTLETTERPSDTQALSEWNNCFGNERLVLEFLYHHAYETLFEAPEAPARLDHEAKPEFQQWLKSKFTDFKAYCSFDWSIKNLFHFKKTSLHNYRCFRSAFFEFFVRANALNTMKLARIKNFLESSLFEVNLEKGCFLSCTTVSSLVGALKKEGYSISFGTLPGLSGINHVFDLLTKKDEEIIAITIASDVEEVGVETITSHFAKVYDSKPTKSVVIAFPKLSDEAKKLANLYKIEVIEGETIEEIKGKFKDFISVR